MKRKTLYDAPQCILTAPCPGQILCSSTEVYDYEELDLYTTED